MLYNLATLINVIYVICRHENRKVYLKVCIMIIFGIFCSMCGSNLKYFSYVQCKLCFSVHVLGFHIHPMQKYLKG